MALLVNQSASQINQSETELKASTWKSALAQLLDEMI